MFEALYLICNITVFPAWLLLLFAPQHAVTRRVVHSGAASALFCVVYSALIIATLGTPSEGGFESLAALSLLFSRPEAALIGWIHYLAFDLLVGSWEIRDMERVGVSLKWRFLVLPPTLMLGPFGLLLYLTIRSIVMRHRARVP